MKIDIEILTREIPEKAVNDFLAKYPELKEWLRIKGEKTQRHYIRRLMRYIETLKLNGIASSPIELWKMAREGFLEGDETRHIRILEEFQLDAKETLPEDKHSLIFNITIVVKSFYSFKGKIYQFPKNRAEFEYQPKKEKNLPDLKKLPQQIEALKQLRDRVIVALETSFPCRLESLVFLKWKNFRELLEGKELPHIYLTSKEMKGKGKHGYRGIEQHSFLTPFSQKYVLAWKEEYERITKKKISLENPESLEEPFLICVDKDNLGKPITYHALNQRFTRLKTEGEFPYNLHIFRTWFNEQLKEANIDKTDRDIFLGHAPDKIEEAYSKVNIERLRKRFKDALKYLDATYKGDERALKLAEIFREKGVYLSEEEAKAYVDKYFSMLFDKLREG
jgi:hypothetical protein